jgi:hypothetical protein
LTGAAMRVTSRQMSDKPEAAPDVQDAAPAVPPAIIDTPPAVPPAIIDTPPDRLAANPRSPFHDPVLLERGVGIRFDGVERTNVDEYCVSEGWVKVAAGKSKDRFGNALTIKLKGQVEPYFRS